MEQLAPWERQEREGVAGGAEPAVVHGKGRELVAQPIWRTALTLFHWASASGRNCDVVGWRDAAFGRAAHVDSYSCRVCS
jgi:hypothetical protein